MCTLRLQELSYPPKSVKLMSPYVALLLKFSINVSLVFSSGNV